MLFAEEKRDLFSVPEEYFLAHCISADYALGAGIAAEFQRRFHLRSHLNEIGGHIYPDCIRFGRIFNLVTKNNYWNKPTYESLTVAIRMMKAQCELTKIQKLAMPKIGCGLDRLQWGRVMEILKAEFADTDIEILVCSL